MVGGESVEDPIDDFIIEFSPNRILHTAQELR